MPSILAHEEQTIVALCTPRGSGALALIRLSGSDALSIATSISSLSRGKKLIDQETHTIHYGIVIDNAHTKIDTVLFLVMKGPKTFTGQDTVEITCHNNPYIIEAIIEQACLHGARNALPGEFTQRAVLHNKIDLLQAEAINDLVTAQTAVATKQALSQVSGTLSAHFATIEQHLLKALMLCEASFEFLDEENLSFTDSITSELNQVTRLLSLLEKSFSIQDILRQGIRIALIGSVNAGKSSLFNTLLGKERAIVTPIAGTTRDVVESTVTRNGLQITLIDTAGLRTTKDLIEQEGIKRSFKEAASADVILLVRDGSRELTAQESELYITLSQDFEDHCICVVTKDDLIEKSDLASLLVDIPCIQISNTTGKGIKELEEQIDTLIRKRLQKTDTPFLVTQRQQKLLKDIQEHLMTLSSLITAEDVPFELLAYHLKEALSLLGECTGKTISEQSMDAIFKTFCVGK